MQPELTTESPDAPLTPPTQLTFARRAEPWELPELMDAPCGYQEFRAVLEDLSAVNRLTRGYKPTLAFLDRIVALNSNAALISKTVSSRPQHGAAVRSGETCISDHQSPVISTGAERSGETPVLPKPATLRILDVGSGGGDTLRAIARWAAARNVPVELTGIDLNPHSTRAAEEFSTKDHFGANITFLTADVFSYSPSTQPDIILSALFTHHLSSPEIVRFLSWMEQHARLGWFVNDLHRSRRAAFWFRFLPVIFRWHRFIACDGPVSLRRSFVVEDWLRMLAQADITSAAIEQHPMNRLCVARIRPLP